MFRTRRQLSDHETRLAALSLAVAEIRQALARSTNQALHDELKVICDDIELMRTSLRSLHGKVAIAKRYEQPKPPPEPDLGPADGDLAAWLDLQNGTQEKH